MRKNACQSSLPVAVLFAENFIGEEMEKPLDKKMLFDYIRGSRFFFSCIQRLLGEREGIFADAAGMQRAGVAQLAEYKLPKLGATGSNPVTRSM